MYLLQWVMGIHRPKAIADKVDFWCLHCQQCYKTYSDLMDHYKSTHEIIRYCCVYCGIYLRMEDFWMDHVKLFHPDVSKNVLFTSCFQFEIQDEHTSVCYPSMFRNHFDLLQIPLK